MDLKSLRRMQRANAMDTDNKSHRHCVRWDEAKRREMAKLALRLDGTASFIARVLGMSTTAVRREAKRLGIQLRKVRGTTPATFDVDSIVYRTMLTHLAITMDMDYGKTKRWIETIHQKKVKNDDAKLLPMMKAQWLALESFEYPYRNLPAYKINDIHDGVILQCHRKYTARTVSHVLSFNLKSVYMRCRELDSACRSDEGLSDVQMVWLSTMLSQLVAPWVLKSITGLPIGLLERIGER